VAADVPSVVGVAAEVAAGAPARAAADVPAAGAAAPAAAVDRAFAPNPGVAAVAAAAFAVYVDRQPFAGPRAGAPVSAAAQRAGAPDPVASACSAALADVAARVADCRSVADLMAESLEAGRSRVADWAAHSAAAYWVARH
jgi:hypothetical protein